MRRALETRRSLPALLLTNDRRAHAAGDQHGLTNVGGPHKLNVRCSRTHCEAIQLLFAEDDQCLDRVQRVVRHTDPRSTQLYADMAEYHVWQALETGPRWVIPVPSMCPYASIG